MESIEKSKKKRRAYRAVSTRLVNKAEEILAEELSIDRHGKLQQVFEELRDKRYVLKQLDEEILDLLIDNDIDDETCENEATEASAVQEKVGICLKSIENALEPKEQDMKSSRIVSRASSLESLTSSIVEEINAQGRKVKLPKLELKKFGGNIAEWQEFWDGFRSAVHDDPTLAKVDKFKYLRSYLVEPARSVVTGFSLTDADYDSAVELLRKRYAKPSVIKRAHLNDIINLAPVFSDRNVPR
eukprot:gene9577-biopygen7909